MDPRADVTPAPADPSPAADALAFPIYAGIGLVACTGGHALLGLTDGSAEEFFAVPAADLRAIAAALPGEDGGDPSMARPKKSLDEKLIETLAFNGARNSEIAAILECDAKTIAGRFSRLLDKTRARRRVALRTAQTKAAVKGDKAMLIWLGKQELEQLDRPAAPEPPENDMLVDLTADDPTPAV